MRMHLTPINLTLARGIRKFAMHIRRSLPGYEKKGSEMKQTTKLTIKSKYLKHIIDTNQRANVILKLKIHI